MMSPAKTRNL